MRKIVVIGGGMVAARFVENVLKHDKSGIELHVVGEEQGGTYNRIMLSPVLTQETTFEEIRTHTPAWYAQNGITLHDGVRAIQVDKDLQTVQLSNGKTLPYDELVLATGATSFMPPIPNIEGHGVFGYRTLKDTQDILQRSQGTIGAIILGGGVLGLEAANGLVSRGIKTTVVHMATHIMNRQLDFEAASIVQKYLEAKGVEFKLNTTIESFSLIDGHLIGANLANGDWVRCGTAIVAAGIRPDDRLVQNVVACNNGILVDEHLQTNQAHIYAIGDCARFEGVNTGLVETGYRQADVLASNLVLGTQLSHVNAPISTRLKVTGVDVYSDGVIEGGEGYEVLTLKNALNNSYRKAVIRDNKLVGALCINDLTDSKTFSAMIHSKECTGCKRDQLLFKLAA